MNTLIDLDQSVLPKYLSFSDIEIQNRILESEH
jgi:hypothetical protein